MRSRGTGTRGGRCGVVWRMKRGATGQPLVSEPLDLIGQKKTCPLAEPSVALAWPFRV